MFDEEEDEAPHYEVGYKKPPREHQFKPGNKAAAGRRSRRHAAGIQSLLHKVMKEKITVSVDGKRVRMTRKEAMIRSLIYDSRKSNRETLRLLELLLDSPEEQIADVVPQTIKIEFVGSRPTGLPGEKAKLGPPSVRDTGIKPDQK